MIYAIISIPWEPEQRDNPRPGTNGHYFSVFILFDIGIDVFVLVNLFCKDRRGFQSVYENKGFVLMDFKREGSLQYNHTMR
jgi:hypothetical protein